jgi:pyruvate,water dikinase
MNASGGASLLRLIERIFRPRRPDAIEQLRARVGWFRDLVDQNNRVLRLMAAAEERLGGEHRLDRQYLRWLDGELAESVQTVVQDLSRIAPRQHAALEKAFHRIRERALAAAPMDTRVHSGPLCVVLGRAGSEDADLLGEKSARLGELRCRLNIPVPEGFVVTAAAFDGVVRSTGAGALIEKLDSDPADSVAAETRDRLRHGPLPRSVLKAIRSNLKPFGRHARFAVRSSAIGEDGELSFAGVHSTLMNVPREGVIAAYQQVLASLFSQRALAYRKSHGLPAGQAAMAVGCLSMVPAVASGVLYTFDPADPSSDAMLISAAWGYGTTVVEGSGATDRFLVDRRPPHPIVKLVIAEKTHQLVTGPVSGLRREPVPPGRRREPCIGASESAALAAMALAVESHMRSPQDIEWALDAQGELWILQARPLPPGPSPAVRPGEMAAALASHPVLMRGAGAVACRGIAAGRVVTIDPGAGIGAAPPGSVLVTRNPTPELAPLLPSAAALIADSGSPAGHLAALAREQQVPAVMATEVATRILQPGTEVTVDAEENVVYAGRVEALIRYGLWHANTYADSRELRALRRMLKFVTPLHLRDPASRRFAAEWCSSYHDIIRFAHEKAVMALSDLDGFSWRDARRHIRGLLLDIPLGLSLIDLGGGVAEDAPPGDINLGNVVCAPLAAVLGGLTAPGVWDTRPTGMDLKALMSSLTRSDAASGFGSAEVRRNLAIVSARYMNLSLFLGYHFNVIDCYLGDRPDDSYILFRFAGGVSELARRARRAELLERILTRQGFGVERSGDLVIARLNGIPAGTMEGLLRMTGRLIGYTRQLDVLLHDDHVTLTMAEEFLAQIPSP